MSSWPRSTSSEIVMNRLVLTHEQIAAGITNAATIANRTATRFTSVGGMGTGLKAETTWVALERPGVIEPSSRGARPIPGTVDTAWSRATSVSNDALRVEV